jgi:ATP phosphoribosyltransferase regulatory subunit
MNPANRQRLRTPQGTESFFLEEAYRHRQLLRMIEDQFASWGYLPVLTPVFDYFDTYRPLLDRSQEERSYRFPDRDGELLMLRSDITLFLAKQMGLSLGSAPLPRRVYYADSIIRHQEEEDISSDEFFQSGAELIGMEGREADLEVLMLLHNILEAMRLPRWRMHIGSRNLMDTVLQGAVDPGTAGDLLEVRDMERLAGLMKEGGLSHSRQRTELLMFLGTFEEFSAAGGKFLKDCGSAPEITAVGRSINLLETLASDLSATASKDNIRIDLSEHGGQPYYTGFTVRVYAEGANSAIASGGRYDNLLGAFGSPSPAAGFSLMMRKIEPISGFAADAAGETPVTVARGSDFPSRYRDAAARRLAGERVAMTAPKDSR